MFMIISKVMSNSCLIEIFYIFQSYIGNYEFLKITEKRDFAKI